MALTYDSGLKGVNRHKSDALVFPLHLNVKSANEIDYSR